MTPLLGMHTRIVPRHPNLIGVLDNGDLIDLDGGTIELYPNQVLQSTSFGDKSLSVQDGRHEYTLRFTKTVGRDDEWIRWFVANDLPFVVAGIRFRLTSWNHEGAVASYVAEGTK